MKKPFFLFLFFMVMLTGCASTADQPIEITPSLQLTQTDTPVIGIEFSVTPSMTVDPENFVSTMTVILESSPTLSSTDITDTPTPQPELPSEHYITGLYGHKQYFSLGCEAGVAVDWAAYFGVTINEFEFQMSLPLSDNPDLGFVGSVYGPWGQVPPYAYGVHAAPVATLLQSYGLNAQAIKGYTIEELKQQIAMDQPVIAWVIGNVVGGIPYEYIDSQGNSTIVAAYEHVIIITGYDEEMIRFNNNGKVYQIPYDVFENSWSVLGNMVLFMGDDKNS